MRVLLDTSTFLWWNMDDPKLSVTARELIRDSRNEVFLSAASAWEIAIKTSKGRLILPEPPDKYVATRLSQHNFSPLPIELSHALQVYGLPDIHQDPFDRLLIAQSQLEDLPILTKDSDIINYPVEVIW